MHDELPSGGDALDTDTRLRVVARTRVGGDMAEGPVRRTVSSYADPVALLVSDTVAEVLALLPETDTEPGTGTGTSTGVLTVSETGTLHTMRTLAAGLGRGRISPLRFAGAGPGSLAGLACIVHGLRGPSLVLTMPPTAAEPLLVPLVHGWLTTGGCRQVVVNEHLTDAAGTHFVRSRVVRHTAN
ncbi:hypothetical protein GCM10010387_48920 [Streptomyces inusitatus]|uniref:Uncharacterized protein n=1 Tax=Streptomyces inusitatus TaxID=68221 RepID=A0A918QIW5_9ACTN|nr:polyketide synthase [Streptomyces inusitatus]GGZ48761.1 hypothetical protein GCM10010387_48920 [Streptomyces inusitatus]